jgi:hypothetical protein
MKFTALTAALCLFVACEDDRGSTPDLGIPRMDAAGDTPMQDAHPGVDCAAIGCGDDLSFRVPGFLTRFGEDAKIVDVTACRASSCGSARLQWLSDQASRWDPVDGGLGSVGGSLLNDTLVVSFSDDTRSPGLTPHQDQVSLRVVTSAGRPLIDFRGQVTTQVFCPGGLGCGICESVTVQLDQADGGQAVDANRPGVCQ